MNIRDIAELAGVSASTVSKVMNGKDKDISEETRKKVLKVIEEEDYVPYFKFLEKEGLKNHLIGLILHKDNRERDSIVLAAEEAVRERGYSLVISYMDESQGIEQLVEEMRRKKISGMLIDSAKWIPEKKFENAAVYLNSTKEFDDREKAVFYYRLSEAGIMAAEKLIDAGHRKIACIICREDASIMNGFRTEMQRRNLAVQPLWTYEGKSVEEIEKYGIPQMISENVTAVICGSPEIACCVCKAMERCRTGIPDDLSIVSIGDNHILELLGCGVTAVGFPGARMATEAVKYLVEMIETEKQIEVIRRLPPVFIQRNSVVQPPQEKQGEKIVVVGSMNMDVTIEVPSIPVEGETQLASKVYIYPGGKGANQAVGVGKLGGQAYLVGCLGNDIDGKQLYASLTENHVHLDGVRFDMTLPSGKAYINVDRQGESTIVVYQGANRNLNVNHINRYRYLFQNAKYCLLSIEIPETIAEHTIKFCKQNHTEVILKPSTATKIKEELLADVSYLVPNENELHLLVKGDKTIEEKANILLEKGVKNIIVTMGSKGCYLRNREYALHYEGTGFQAVDTTGGADSFISAMAVYLSEGKELLHAISFAIYASGISVTRQGVQPALPDRRAVDIYEDEIHQIYEEKRRRDRKDEKNCSGRKPEHGCCD